MQAMPSPRIPARRPGLQETLRRFSAGLWLPQPFMRPECGTAVESRRNRRTGDRMTRAGRHGWRPEAKRDRTSSRADRRETVGRWAQCEAPISWRAAGI